MHTALVLTSVLLVVLGGYLALLMLRRLNGWSRRRDLQFMLLAAPLVSLGLGIAGLYHFTDRTCFLSAPHWDATLAVALPLGMGLIAFGGLSLGLVRLVLMNRLVARSGTPAGPELQALADRLAERLSVPELRLRLCAYDRPLALTCGLFRPTVLLSRWMVECLDRRELESVLAHELAHVARRDYLVVWLATVLRDAFFYLPTTWAVYRQLQHEKELACDDLAVGVTNRPLALASALAKVWQQALSRPHLEVAQLLVGTSEPIEGRIDRLLTTSGREAITANVRSRRVGLRTGTGAFVGLLILEAANVVVMLASMGYGPAVPLGKLL